MKGQEEAKRMNKIQIHINAKDFDVIGVKQLLIRVDIRSISLDWRKEAARQIKLELLKLEEALNESNAITRT